MSKASEIAQMIRHRAVAATVVAAINRLSKDDLENIPGCLLSLAVDADREQEVAALLAKGVRSGHALTIAIVHQNIAMVKRLLAGGVYPCESAERLATALEIGEIAAIISETRDKCNAFRTDIEF